MRFPDRRWLLDRVRGAGEVASGRATAFDGVCVISDSEMTVEFDEPLGIFPAVLTHSSFAIVPEGTDVVAGTWHESCIGTGPFRVTRFEPGHRLDQAANPDYWRAGFPRTDGLSHRFGIPQADILAGYREGRFSLAWNLDAEERESLRNDPEYGPLLHEYPTLATYFLVFNAHSGPLADESLRRRLAASVDVDALTRASFGASAMPARSLIPPGLLGYEPPRRISKPAGVSRKRWRRAGAVGGDDSGCGGVAREVAIGGIRARGRSARRFDSSPVAPSKQRARKPRSMPWSPAGSATIRRPMPSRIRSCIRRLVSTVDSSEVPSSIGSAKPVVSSRIPMRGTTSTGRSSRSLSDRALLLPFCHRQSYCFVQPEIRGVRLRLSPSSLAFDRLRFAK